MNDTDCVQVWWVDGHFGGSTRWILEVSEQLSARIQAEADYRDVYTTRFIKDLIKDVAMMAEGKGNDYPSAVVLAAMELPVIRLVSYADRRWFAVVIHGVRADYHNWCHQVGGEGVPWHASSEEAWECFNQNHLEFRIALEKLQK